MKICDKFGKLDASIPLLGSGMRSAGVNGNQSQVDEAQDNQDDTVCRRPPCYNRSLYGYHRGNSEIVIGRPYK